MTELYIDGVSVPLPAEFEISVKHENPFFTKNGEYTYDIELSLNIPVVAQLYGFLNRLNKADTVATDRKAVLIADNRVYIDGTEIITGWSDTTVQIQLVSGNSQLNYFVGSDKLISDLEGMPETEPGRIMYEGGRWSPYGDNRMYKYPDIRYCTTPVWDSTNNEFVNPWNLSMREYSPGKVGFTVNAIQNDPSYWAPQPYICPFIEELLKAIGYNLTYNAIEDTDWKMLCILHVQRTHKWNEILPDWSVKEFLEAIETFFNARFVINKKTKDVKLVFNNQYYLNAPVAYVSRVIDEYKVECDEEDVKRYDKATLQYTESSTTYGKLRCLPDNVASKRYDADILSMTPEVYFSIEENRKDNLVFHFSQLGRDVIYKGMKDSQPLYEAVNQFAPLKRAGSEVLEMPVSPVELSHIENYDSGRGDTLQLFFPNIGGDTKQDVSVDASITELVENSSSGDKSKPKLQVGYFWGSNKVALDIMPAGTFPVVMIDRYIHTEYGEALFSDMKDTLMLSYMNNELFNNAYDIDYQNPVEFTSYDDNVFDVNSVFVINNKRYICEYIEYKVDERGRAGAWTGKFYPIKISDTETLQKWILSDGKYRDGGVWLDNGRWLDN